MRFLGCTRLNCLGLTQPGPDTKLGDLGYSPIITDVDITSVNNMKWFDALSAGKQHTDFFANRVTNYSKGTKDWDASAIF